MKKLAFMMGAALLLDGCTHAISHDLLEQSQNISFSRLQAEPGLHRGSLVILGGTITGTKSEGSMMEIAVAQRSLDGRGRPLRTAQPAGRFLVRHAGTIDAGVYGRGREITVAGVVEGYVRSGSDDNGEVSPVLVSKELKLWPREPASWSRQQYLDPLYDRDRSSPIQY